MDEAGIKHLVISYIVCSDIVIHQNVLGASDGGNVLQIMQVT